MKFDGFDGIFKDLTKQPETSEGKLKKNSSQSKPASVKSKDDDNFRKLSAEIASTYSDSINDEAKERGKAMAEGFYQNLMVLDSLYGGSLFKASAAVAQYDIPVALQAKNDYMKMGAYAVGGNEAVEKLNKRSFEVGYKVMNTILDIQESTKKLIKKSMAKDEVEIDLVRMLRGDSFHKVSSAVAETPDSPVTFESDDNFSLVAALRDKKWVKRSLQATLKKNSQGEDEFEVTLGEPVEVGTLEAAIQGSSDSVIENVAETAGAIAGAEAGVAAADAASAITKEETGVDLSQAEKKNIASKVQEDVTDEIKKTVEDAAASAVEETVAEGDLTKTSNQQMTEADLQKVFENFNF